MMKCLASKITAIMATTYVFKQHFFLMNISKIRLRSKVSNAHLNSILEVATAQSLGPNFEALVHDMRWLVSGSNSSRK